MIDFLSSMGQKIAGKLNERTDFGVDLKSPSIAQMNQYFEQYKVGSLLPYRNYDPSQHLFFNERSVGFVLETYPMVGCSEEMQREISGLFQDVLPEGSSLQFILWADPKIGAMLDAWEKVRHQQGGIFQKMAEERVRHLKTMVKTPPDAALRDFRCIVAYSQPGFLDTPVETQKILQLKEQVKTALKTLGMPLKEWSADDLLNTLDSWVNFTNTPDRDVLKWNPNDALNIQIPSKTHAFHLTKDSIHVNEGDATIRTYSVRREPDLWSLHAMGDLIGAQDRDLLQIPCPFIIHYGIHICNQDKTKMRVQSRESWVEKQARSKIGKRIPILMKQSRELDFVRHQQSKGERFVQTNFTVTLFSTPEMTAKADQVLLSLFRSKRWQLNADVYVQLPTFLSNLPMNWGEGYHKDLHFFDKLKTTLSTESANLLPIQAEWKGTDSYGMLFMGRRGQLYNWSPFDNRTGNYNVAVVGKSGSGKSVFMQELVTTTLGQGGQVFVLDVGRSFEKTVKLLGGEYIEFTTNSNICINPFSSIPMDNPSETEDVLAMLKPIISLMAAPREGTGDLENSYIEQALRAAWDANHQQATISHVAEYLLKHKENVAQSLGQKLFPYTKDGIYGRFFEGPANVSLSARMVVVELEELKERKDLQEVIVQMVILQITNKLYLGDRKTMSHVVLDEAWDMLRGKQSGVFIETAARRLRKYHGSLVVGTQSVNDFYATPAAQAAFENSDWMCLLAQKPESIQQLKKSGRIMMDPALEAMLTSVKTKQGEYAEVLISGPHGYAVGRLFLDPFSQILYSTKPEDFSAVQDLVGKGMALESAVQKVSQRRVA